MCRVGAPRLACSGLDARHRPWKPASAWAVLAAAEGATPPSLSAYERHRALKRLKRAWRALSVRCRGTRRRMCRNRCSSGSLPASA